MRNTNTISHMRLPLSVGLLFCAVTTVSTAAPEIDVRNPMGAAMKSGDSVRFRSLHGTEQVLYAAEGGIPSGTPGASYVLEGSFDGGDSGLWTALASPEVVGPNGKVQSEPSFSPPFLRTVRIADETRTFTLRNLGSTPLTGIQFDLEGENADDFSVTASGGLPSSLPAGGSKTFEVTVTPSGAAPPKALLNIQSNDANENPFVILFNGDRSYRLKALEVTQGVQDWDISVPLVTGRRTFVRAFLERMGSALPPKAKLLGFGPTGASLGEVMPLKLSGKPFRVPTSVTLAVRASNDQCLTFELPPAWVSQEANLTLKLDLGDDLLVVDSGTRTPEVQSDGRLTLPLAATDVLRLIIQPFVLTNGTAPGSEEVRLTDKQISQVVSSIRKLFPVPDVQLGRLPERKINGLGVTTPRDVGNLCQRLNQQREEDIANASGQALNALKQTYYLVLLPLDFTLGESTYDFTSGVAANEPTAAAHELAHCLRQVHATDAALGFGPLDPDGLPMRKGHCGELAEGEVEPFPYFFASPGQSAVRPRIGPLNLGENRIVFGFDQDAMKPLDPRTRTELMGYCEIGKHWISEWTYKGLFTELRRRRQVSTLSRGFERVNGIQSVTSVLTIEGIVSTSQPSEISSCISALAEPTVPPDVSPRMLRLLGEAGEILVEQRLRVSGTGSDGTFSYFETHIALPASPVASVVLLENGLVVDTLSAGVQIPIVSSVNLSNNAGGAFTLSWTASDLDGDSLKSTVLVSYDAGASWSVLTSGISETSFPIPVAEMSAGTGVRFRVTASDGIRVSVPVEASGSIAIANHAPQISIITPLAGQAAAAAESLQLVAEVFDYESPDSALAVTWSSDLAGVLGTGRELTLPAFTLAVGTHQIQASVRDASGLVTVSSLPVIVTEPALPELTSMETDSDGALDLFITAPRNGRIQTEISTDLLEWLPIDVRTFDTGAGVIESSIIGTSHRFYRWRVLPPF